MEELTVSHSGTACQTDTLPVALGDAIVNPHDSPATFEKFTNLPTDIQWNIFEELLNIEGLRHGPTAHSFVVLPTTLAQRLFETRHRDNQTASRLCKVFGGFSKDLQALFHHTRQLITTGQSPRQSLAGGLAWVTQKHLHRLGKYTRKDARVADMPGGCRYLRLQKIAQSCSLARRVVNQAHRDHGSTTVIPLYGGQSILASTEHDLFHIDFLVRPRIFLPGSTTRLKTAKYCGDFHGLFIVNTLDCSCS
ncbi:hypothetical protein QBC40DRAFT_101679 [Triangularia verruculosa]|uniref:Uncharacterized protein n=1 Tax=Triangularia verruculosa TaxID=2587418 RepID=A0AAN6XFH6_9PEZI|nr:hypothetical protein QBC40DRAFT_101679 [Triangularia verruculosa]